MRTYSQPTCNRKYQASVVLKIGQPGAEIAQTIGAPKVRQ